MAESFLHLIATEQSQILRGLAPRLSRSPTVLEKDVWVCWVLQTLFAIPNRLPMVFKGGTSLSKVFKAIARFSEDVDITLDYRSLDGSLDPFSEGVSNSRLKKFSEELKGFVRHYVHTVVVPHFREKLIAEFGTGGHRIEVSEDGEQLRVHYSTVLGTPGDYVGNSVADVISLSQTRSIRYGPILLNMLQRSFFLTRKSMYCLLSVPFGKRPR